MPLEDLVKQVAGTLEHDASSQAVFGPAIELQNHIIVPVAVVSGGAAGGGTQPASQGSFAGGAGMGLNVRPVGFIHESGDHVIFTPIHVDERKRSPLVEVANGVRRLLDLAYSVVAQFVQVPTRIPAPRRTPGDGASVGSPS